MESWSRVAHGVAGLVNSGRIEQLVNGSLDTLLLGCLALCAPRPLAHIVGEIEAAARIEKDELQLLVLIRAGVCLARSGGAQEPRLAAEVCSRLCLASLRPPRDRAMPLPDTSNAQPRQSPLSGTAIEAICQFAAELISQPHAFEALSTLRTRCAVVRALSIEPSVLSVPPPSVTLPAHHAHPDMRTDGPPGAATGRQRRLPTRRTAGGRLLER